MKELLRFAAAIIVGIVVGILFGIGVACIVLLASIYSEMARSNPKGV